MLRNGTALAAALCGLLALTTSLWADGPPAGCACGSAGCGPAGCGSAGCGPAGCGPSGCGHDACCPDCGKTVCKPICQTKTVVKPVYTEGCEEYCNPCSITGMLFGKCGCGKVHHRKYLILKYKKTDYCCKSCVPVHEPSCSAPCAGGCGAAPCAGGCGCAAGHPNMTVIHEDPSHGIALPPAAAAYPPATMPPAQMPPAVTVPAPMPAAK